MLPWVVCDDATGAVIGTSRYHDIVRAIDRVEIGHTWYRHSAQRTHVNTTCKLLLLGHAFGNVKVIREHIELLAIAVVLLSVLPLVFEMTRRRIRSRRGPTA